MNMRKWEVDEIVDRLVQMKDSIETRSELEKYLGESYTQTQKERIWHRYRYRLHGRND